MATAHVNVFDLPFLHADAYLDYSGTAVSVWVSGKISLLVTSIDFESPHLTLSALQRSRSITFSKDGVDIRLQADLDIRRGVVVLGVYIDAGIWSRGTTVELSFLSVPAAWHQLLPPAATSDQIDAVRSARSRANPIKLTPTFTSDPAGFQTVRDAFAMAGVEVPSPAEEALHRRDRATLGIAAQPPALPGMTPELTAIGAGVELGIVFDAVASGGLYWTDNGEIGLYGSPGYGVGLVLSVSAGVILSTFWSGKDTFKGECVSASVTFGEVIVGGVEIFWNVGNPVPVGASYVVGVGAGNPIDLAVHRSYTWLYTLRQGY